MYAQTRNPDLILREADNTFIPRDDGNWDYIEFLKWEAEGGVIAPYVEPAQPEQ